MSVRVDKEGEIYKLTGIYMIRCKPNGKVYVGQSTNIERRFKEHRKHLNGGYHTNKELQKDWNDYEEDNFEFKVIQKCKEEDLDELEILHTEQLDSFKNGYNKTKGGNDFGAKGEDNHMYGKCGELHPSYGTHLSEETKKKISEAKKGVYCGENHPMYGKHHTEETKQKLSDNHKGENNPNYGRCRMEETKKKISEAHKGMIRSEESRKKQSEHHADYTGSKHPRANMVICIYPDGTQTKPMCIKEMSEHLGISRKTVRNILKSDEPYKTPNKVPNKNFLKTLEGIKIIKLEKENDK